MLFRSAVPIHREFTATAIALEKSGQDFNQIFAAVCRQALVGCATNSNLRYDDSARYVFAGLWLWVNNAGAAKLQGRHDWAQHFIGGGAFEGYLDIGPRAAVTKETIDSRDPGNRYDLDDLAATLLGSRWMDLATSGGPAQAKRWLELWATGQMSLSNSLPKLQLGQLPQFQQAEVDRVQKVRAFVNESLQLPPESPPPAPPQR